MCKFKTGQSALGEKKHEEALAHLKFNFEPNFKPPEQFHGKRNENFSKCLKTFPLTSHYNRYTYLSMWLTESFNSRTNFYFTDIILCKRNVRIDECPIVNHWSTIVYYKTSSMVDKWYMTRKEKSSAWRVMTYWRAEGC